MKNNDGGFTLIELVVVIVILGILAATALPKFVDLGKDARIAALKGLQGALQSAAREGQALCQINSATCNPSKATHTQTDVVGNVVVRDGVTYRFHFSYPIAYDNYPGYDKGIGSFVDYTGFTRLPYLGGTYFAAFTKDGAPDPDNCKVIYQLPISAPGAVTVTTVESGCGN